MAFVTDSLVTVIGHSLVNCDPHDTVPRAHCAVRRCRLSVW